MADVVRSSAKTEGAAVRLLTQDPGYTDEKKKLLRDIGYEVVGEYGARGFAEVDEESIVFSTFTKAPVKQVIADFARPVAIITARSSTAGGFGKPGYHSPNSYCHSSG